MIYKPNIPTISVIIPTYNRTHLIERAIQSVLNQTYQDFEIIVVDDGSIDNTKEVLESFSDKRIRYIRHEKNRGGAVARNTGIKIARGEYIGFLDDDSEWLSKKLEKQMKAFEAASPEVSIVYTGLLRIENDRKVYIPSPTIKKKENNIQRELLKKNFIDTSTILVKKECLNKVGVFDERLPRFQDWELVIRISKCYKFKLINEPLVISYYTADSISADQNALIKGFELILEKYSKDFAKDKKLLAECYFNIGNLLSLNKEIRKGRNYLIKSIAKYPFSIKAFLAVFVSLFGQNCYSKAIAIHRKIKSLITKK